MPFDRFSIARLGTGKHFALTGRIENREFFSNTGAHTEGARMPNLKVTMTHETLNAAFAGESQANRRYLYFAKQADVEGRPDVAGLFRDTAEGETGHAHGHLEYLEQ